MGGQTVLVAGDEYVIRFIPRNHYQNGEVTLAALKLSADPTPSAYLPSKRTLEEIEAANPKWPQQGYSLVKVADLNALGIQVELKPADCPYPAIADAHVNLVGITADGNRQAAVELLSNNLKREPR
jgi:hypothetical protein